MSSITLGVAALVAIDSFAGNVTRRWLAVATLARRRRGVLVARRLPRAR
jgi:hypothetical protein